MLVKLMKSILSLIVLSLFMHTQPANAQAKIKSFKEWKLEQVSTANANLNSLKSKAGAKRTAQQMNKKDPNLVKGTGFEGHYNQSVDEQNVDAAIQSETEKLEMTKDLSVTDYFVGYLAKQANRKEAYKEAAGKLSPDEVAELLSAYANSVFEGHGTELPANAINQIQKEQ